MKYVQQRLETILDQVFDQIKQKKINLNQAR